MACLGLVIAEASAAEFKPEDATKLQQAQTNINNENYQAAVEPLLGLQQVYPDAGVIPRLLTHAYFGLKQFDLSRKAAVAAINSGQVSADVLTRIAQIDDQRDDKLALLNTVRLLTIIDENSQQWRITYGDLLLSSGAYAECIQVFSTLAETHPDSAVLQARLGNAYLRAERFREAATTLELAWRLGPKQPKLMLAVAGAWDKLGDTEQTARWLERAIAAQPTNPKVSLQLATSLVAIDQSGRAKSVLTPLLDNSPNVIKTDAHGMLGSIAMEAKDTAKAVRHFEAAHALGAKTVKLSRLLGAYHFNAKGFEKAAAFLREAVSAEQSHEETRRFLIYSLIQLKARSEARKQLRVYIEQNGLTEQAKLLAKAWLAISRAQPDE